MSAYEDVDDDGIAEVLFVAGRNDDFGANLSRAFLVKSTDGGLMPLDVYNIPSGHRFGGRGLFDLNNDGELNAVVGAPYAGRGMFNIRSGSAWVYSLQDVYGDQIEPSNELVGMPNRTRDDRLGVQLAHGDFDGDGQAELAVSVNFDEYLGNFGDDFEVGESCTRQDNSGSCTRLLGCPGAES